MKWACLTAVGMMFALGAGSSTVWGMGTAFSYQGRLHVGGDPAEGPYDVQFQLFDDAAAGSPVGATLEADDLDIVGGYFTVSLDFGADVFDGNNRWLAISVRPATSTDPADYVPLLPRQAITPAPYAMYAKSGTPGPQGPIGPKGDKGDTGATGARGPQGLQGIQGVQGVQGTKGDTGATGPAGPKGDKGDTGATGIQGPAGPTLGIYDSLGLASSGGRAAGDAGGRPVMNLGNVGIGTSIPQSRLHVVGGITADYLNSDFLSIHSGADIEMTIDSGNSAPLTGFFELFNGSDEHLLAIDDIGNTYIKGPVSIGGSLEAWGDISAHNGNLRVNGNVGIGTTTPTEKLDVGTGNIRVRGIDEFDASGESAYLYLGDSNQYIKSTFGFGLNLGTWNAPNAVTIREGTGNVGIGTDAPQARLHVESAGWEPQLLVRQNQIDNWARLGIQVWQITSRNANEPNLNFWNGSSNAVTFGYFGTVTATSFNPISDRDAKENFAPVDSREILEKVAAMPITRWNFKIQDGIEHMGPVAQDFHAAFGLGEDDRHIATVDADGVALAAIQGLHQKLEREVAALRSENAELRQHLQTENEHLRNQLREDSQLNKKNQELVEQNRDLAERMTRLENLIERLVEGQEAMR